MVLTAYNGAILGPIAKLLGLIMNAIYVGLYKAFGIENIGICIIILTIIIYLCLLPVTIKQQKFAKLQQKMQPEIQAIQNKYKNKKDQASMQAMNQETQLIYQKYGVSPMGSCLSLGIQMPILLALYKVFYNVPAYVGSVKNTFSGVVSDITSTKGGVDTLVSLVEEYNITTSSRITAKSASDILSNASGTTLDNYIVDIIYKLPTEGWNKLSSYFPNAADSISDAVAHMDKFNYFGALNISDTPLSIIKTNFASHSYLMVILAVLIPVLSYFTQLLNIKLMPQQASDGSNPQADQMMQSMKMMNVMMPLMSFFICFSVPVGLGIYWIAGAVIRVIQQLVINRHIANLDLDDIIRKNEEKAKKKREQMGIAENQIRNAATMSTKKINENAKVNSFIDNEKALEEANMKKANAKAGSMASKANMVRDFNEKNSRK